MKKIVCFIILGMMTFSGCTGQKSGADTSSRVDQPKELEEFTVVLDWYPNAVHGFIYAAIENGYYEEVGLKVNVQFPSGTNDAMSLTAVGKADVGIFYMQDVILAKSNQDVPIWSLGAVCQSPLNVFLSLKEKNITQAKDLVGKTIGECGSQLSEQTIRFLIEGAGGDPQDAEVIDVGFDVMSAMTTGNVDVTLGGMVNHEVPQMEANGFEVNYFFPTDYGMPNYYELILITGQKQVEEKMDVLERFLGASQRGFDYMKENPEETLNLILSNQNQEDFPLNEEVERKSMEILLPVMETEANRFLTQDIGVWEENVQWLYENQLIETKINPQDIIIEIKK